MVNQTDQHSEKMVDSKSTITKGIIIFVLTILMLIPIPIILNLIEERQEYQESVLKDISQKWSGSQVIFGPFVQITYINETIDPQGKVFTTTEYYYVSANENSIKADVKSSIKKRNLYEAIIYNSTINLSSSFPTYEKMIAELNLKASNITAVKIVFAINDSKGYENKAEIIAAGQKYPLVFDENVNFIENTVKDKDVPMDIQVLSRIVDPFTFDFNLIGLKFSMKGSQKLEFIPSALQTNINLSSNWKDLKFDGYVLPSDTAFVKDKDATVSWKIFQQNPLKGQYWTGKINFDSYKFGVDFLQMNDHYDKTYRSTKYAILFIGLTFVAFFFIENKNKLSIHIVQYALVGFAIAINFVLLLSISEYLGFDYAYMISSVATIVMITLFVNSFVNNWKLTSKITTMLIFLYAFIYSVLQLKEHALLVGSLGLFFILGIIMYYSKSIEWNTKEKV